MSDIERIGDATLYRGDCLEIMPSLGSVDHVITDPPYEAEAHTLQCRVKRGTSRGTGYKVMSVEPLSFAPLSSDLRLAIAEALARLSLGWILAFCQAEAVRDWQQALEQYGASWRRSCIWIKPDGMPQYSGDRPGMGYESIACAWAGSGKSVWNGGGKHGIYNYNKSDIRHGHETQKPRVLMDALVTDFTQSGDTILDPFMGSGTTGVACANLGRKFIGIEINREYFDIACERITAAYAQGRLFP